MRFLADLFREAVRQDPTILLDALNPEGVEFEWEINPPRSILRKRPR